MSRRMDVTLWLVVVCVGSVGVAMLWAPFWWVVLVVGLILGGIGLASA